MIKIRVAARLQPRVVNARYLLSMVLDGERRGRLASQGLSANLMIARQENARQGSRSHFPILVKLFALWWQMLVQTSDITVRSQIVKACAHCRRPVSQEILQLGNFAAAALFPRKLCS